MPGANGLVVLNIRQRGLIATELMAAGLGKIRKRGEQDKKGDKAAGVKREEVCLELA